MESGDGMRRRFPRKALRSAFVDTVLTQFFQKMDISWILVPLALLVTGTHANPDAKRLYDDLMSSYNSMIRPVANNSDHVSVKIGLKLSQLIDVVSSVTVKCRTTI
jgi:hypothetical protein